MADFLNRLCKLVDVKSIVTLTFTFGFLFLTLTRVVNAEQFIAIYTPIVGFYFGTQFQKGIDSPKNNKE